MGDAFYIIYIKLLYHCDTSPSMPLSYDFLGKWDKKDKPLPALAKIFFFSNRIDEPRPREREDSGFSAEDEGSLGRLGDTGIKKVY